MTSTFLRGRAPKRLAIPSVRRTLDKNRLRPDIQGLRAFAVLAVILDHLIGWPRGGFVGVDIFFVLSGFLITGLLLREFERTGAISFRGFFKRRIKRILPASMLVLLATLAASYFVFNGARWITTLWDAISAALFASNWRFAIAGTDYFQADGPVSPLQHYWSLAVEEQFYFVWPVVLLASIAIYLKIVGPKGSPRVAAGIAIISISTLSFLWSLLETQNNSGVAYFSTFSRAWELGLGAILAIFAPTLSRIPGYLRPVLAWIGLGGMILALFVIEESHSFPAPTALLPVLSTCIVVAAGTGTGEHRLLAPLTNRVARYIGDISFSLYLWHFPVIVIGSQLIHDSEPFSILVLVGAFTLLSIYSYHLLEDPVRKSSWMEQTLRQHKSPKVISEGYKLTALSAMALVTAAIVVPLLVTKPSAPAAAQLPMPNPTAAKTQEGFAPELATLQRELSAALRADTWPTLSTSVETVIAGGQVPKDILACGLEAKLVQQDICTWGDPSATKTAVIVGDSISLTYVETLRSAVGDSSGWQIKSFGTFACAFADERAFGIDTSDACEARNQDATKSIAQIQPDVVFVAHHYLERKPAGSTTAMTSDQWQKALRARLDPLLPSAGKIVFLSPPPADKDINECFTKTSVPLDCMSRKPQHWYEIAKGEQDLASVIDAVHVDTSNWFCVDDLCPSFARDIPVKMDWAHMSPAYQARLGGVAREQLTLQGIF
ncbi:acyltransferase family protein [Paenarthrobacter nitroguajacolicus]